MPKRKYTISEEGRKRLSEAGKKKHPKKGFGSNPELAAQMGKKRAK